MDEYSSIATPVQDDYSSIATPDPILNFQTLGIPDNQPSSDPFASFLNQPLAQGVMGNLVKLREQDLRETPIREQAIAKIRQQFLQPGDKSAPAQLAEALSKDVPNMREINQNYLKMMNPLTQEAILRRASELKAELNGTPQMYPPRTNQPAPNSVMKAVQGAGTAMETLASPVKYLQYTAEQALGPKDTLLGDVAEKQRLAKMTPYQRMIALRDQPLRNLGKPESEMYRQQASENDNVIGKGLEHLGGTLSEMAINPVTYLAGGMSSVAQGAAKGASEASQMSGLVAPYASEQFAKTVAQRALVAKRLSQALATGEVAANAGFTTQMLSGAVQSSPHALTDPIGFLLDSGMAVLGVVGLRHALTDAGASMKSPPDTLESHGRTFELKTEDGKPVSSDNGQPVYEAQKLEPIQPTEPTKVSTPPVRARDPKTGRFASPEPITVDSYVQATMDGKVPDTPEYQQFYANNSRDIEASLKQKAPVATETSPEPEKAPEPTPSFSGNPDNGKSRGHFLDVAEDIKSGKRDWGLIDENQLSMHKSVAEGFKQPYSSPVAGLKNLGMGGDYGDEIWYRPGKKAEALEGLKKLDELQADKKAGRLKPDEWDIRFGRLMGYSDDDIAYYLKSNKPPAETPPVSEAPKPELSPAQKMRRNALAEQTGTYGQARVKLNMREDVPEGSLYHETSLEGARKIVPRMGQYIGATHTMFAASDNLDLALGQGGKGVVLEMNPEHLNGRKSPGNKPGLAFNEARGEGGQEYSISKSNPEAVDALIVKNPRTIEALKRDPYFSKRFNFDNPTETSRGVRFERTRRPAKEPAKAPETTAPVPIKATETTNETGREGVPGNDNPSPESRVSDYGASNKIVTSDRYEELKKRISQQKLSTGIDPALLSDLVEMGVYHIEAGTRSLAQWMKKMKEDTGAGDETLKQVWAATRKDERLKAKEPAKAAEKPVEAKEPPKPPEPPKASKAESESSPRESGINQRTNEARNRGIDPGTRIGTEEGLANGRAWLRKGGDPEALLTKLASVHSTPSDENFFRLRAHQEVLDRASNRAGDEFGLDSEQYKTAKAAEDSFASRYKELSTRAGASLAAHIGGTDLDTGSVTSLIKHRTEGRDTPATPGEKQQAKKFVLEVKRADEDIKAADQKIKDALAEGKVETAPSRVPSTTEKLREYFIKKFMGGFKIPKNPEGGAIRIPQGHRVFSTAEVKTLWDYAKKNYIGLGDVENQRMWSLDEISKDMADKLGIGQYDQNGNFAPKPEWVKSAFTQNKTVRKYVTEVLKRQYDRRQTIKESRLWVKEANKGPVRRALDTIGTFPMSFAIFGHGGVGMITHAGANIARPSGWIPYWRNFARQYPLVFNKAYHEAMMQQMEAKDNHTFKLAVGLAVDPSRLYDNYQQYGRLLGGLGRSGNRGMDALKLFRDELFDVEWNRLDPSLRTKNGTLNVDMGKELANWVNHVSGKGDMGQLTNIVGNKMFAPSLEAARWARTLGDPIKTATTLINKARGENVSPEEYAIAQLRVKRATELLATYTALLGANNALLSATGQKERVNFTDPTSTDWLKFKWGGRTIDPTGGSSGPLRFLATLTQMFTSSNPKTYGEKSRFKAAGNEAFYYGRGKLAPQLGILADLSDKQTMDRRPLTFRTSKEERVNDFPYGEPIGPLEYGSRHIPIPFAGWAEEAYSNFHKQGVPKSTAKAIINALPVFGLELTGTRVGHEPKEFAKIPEGSSPKLIQAYNLTTDPVQKKALMDVMMKEAEAKKPVRYMKKEMKYDQGQLQPK